MYRHAFQRHKTREVKVGSVVIGGDQPIVVQSMTTPDTHDVEATVASFTADLRRVKDEIAKMIVRVFPSPPDEKP